MTQGKAIEDSRNFSRTGHGTSEIGSTTDLNADPISKPQTGVCFGHRQQPTMRTEPDRFFSEPANPQQEARRMASEVVCRLLIWMADGRTLDDRGLRASIALYCVRPDLIDGTTLEQIGTLAGCSRQAVHKLASAFRQTTGMQT
jgi:hypothetical protein